MDARIRYLILIGNKGFCAGGDIKSLYMAKISENKEEKQLL